MGAKQPSAGTAKPENEQAPRDEIEAAIQRIYEEAAAEPLPDHIVTLLRRLATNRK